MTEIDAYLRELFPLLFTHLDQWHPITPKTLHRYHWSLLTKENQTLYISKLSKPTDADVLRTRSPAGHKWTEQIIYFSNSVVFQEKSSL